MGKGFNNYMCKKFFHPASRDNLKRVWMAEQKAEAYKKKQEELRQQYEKEQDLHDNKAMLSKDSKDKLSISFMYEPPPGAKKEREREDDEPEYKFEWQRKYNAPRESYCKGDQEIRDQPFGIQVRNVRCIKCHKWGHINTDKECPMYSLSMSAARSLEAAPILDQNNLVQQMLEDGLALKKQHINTTDMEHELMLSDDDENENTEAAFLQSLSKKQKRALLKKLEKLERKSRKEKEKKKQKRRSHSEDSSSDSTSSDSDTEKDDKRQKKSSKSKRDSNKEEQDSRSKSNLNKERKHKDEKYKADIKHKDEKECREKKLKEERKRNDERRYKDDRRRKESGSSSDEKRYSRKRRSEESTDYLSKRRR